MRKLGNLYENEMIFFFSNFACDEERENRFAMQRGFWIVGETCFYFLRELAEIWNTLQKNRDVHDFSTDKLKVNVTLQWTDIWIDAELMMMWIDLWCHAYLDATMT